MIRFACPSCQKLLQAPDPGAGQKTSCPKCGQRMLIPQPKKSAASNRTVLGQLLPSPLPAPTPSSHVESDDLVLLGLKKDTDSEGSLDQPDYPARSCIGNAFAVFALTFAAAAIPAVIAYRPLLATGLASLGVFFSILGLFAVAARRGASWGLSLVRTVVCAFVCFVTIFFLVQDSAPANRRTQTDTAKQDHKDSLTRTETRQSGGSASRVESGHPERRQRREASRRPHRDEEEEGSKPEEDNRPRFDPNDLQRTIQWGQAIVERLQQDAKNGIRYRATLEKLREEIRVHEGTKVRWSFVVTHINEKSVGLSLHGDTVTDARGRIHITDKSDPRQQLLYGSLSLSVGQGISRQKARKLNPGDKITVSAKVNTISLREEYLSNAFTIVFLNDLRAD